MAEIGENSTISSNVFENFTVTSNETKEDFKYLYRNLSTYFLVWYLAVVIVVGFFGAAFCLFFLAMSRLFPKMILIWLISICVGDLMILLLDALRMGLKVWFRVDVRDFGVVSCRLHNFLSNYFFYFSAYMQTFMSLQRLYFVYRPLKARTHLTLRRVTIVWAIVTLVLILPHLPYLLLWHIGKKGDCEPTDVWYYYVTTLLDLSLWGIIPLLSMTISTLVISFKIFSFKETFGAGSGSQNASDSKSNNACTSLQPTGKGRRHGGTDNAAHVTKLLVAMNVFYMVTTYPLLIYLMHLNFGLENKVGQTIPQPVHKFYYYMFRSLCYLNSSLNWVFYCAAGKLFRRRARLILLRLVLCRVCMRQHGDSSQSGFYGAGWDSSQIPLNQRQRGECSASNDRLTVVSRLPSKTPIPDVLPRGKTFRFGPPAAQLLRDQSASNV